MPTGRQRTLRYLHPRFRDQSLHHIQVHGLTMRKEVSCELILHLQVSVDCIFTGGGASHKVLWSCGLVGLTMFSERSQRVHRYSLFKDYVWFWSRLSLS